MPKKPSANKAWCKVCHIWIADNKIQKRQHEEGTKHKEAKVALLKEIAEKNEKKAKDEKRAMAVAAGIASVGTKSASVAQQFLERAAGASNRTPHQPNKRPREISTQESAEERLADDTTTETLRPEEELDENGFPLPVVYGEWKPVAEEDDAGADNAEQYWGQGPLDPDIGNEIEQGDISVPANGNTDKSTATQDVQEATRGRENDEARAEVEGAFKRRAAPRTRRVRRKTTAR